MKDFMRSWRIGRLYFRLIKDTPLEPLGWTGEKLAAELERTGFLKIIKGPDDVSRYVEMPGKYVTKEDVKNLVAKGIIKLCLLFVLISGCATPNRYRYEPTLGEYEASMPGFNTAKPHQAEADGKMNPRDLAGRQCTSTKITNINGTFSHWDTICW